MGEKMINLTIDGVQLQVPEGTSVMSAAAGVGIEVPHLCFLKDINEISACKVCVVEVQGKSKLITACNSPVEEGMVVFTNSPKVRRVRRTNMELILSQHDCHCAICVRSRNCNLQKISNDLGILEVPFNEEVPETSWDHSFPLIRDSRKCIKCMRCVQICDKVQAMHVWDVQNTGSRTTVDVADNKTIDCSDCTLCGQCITHCPTGALRERDDTDKAFAALADPEKITVVQVAPAVRTAWGEELGLHGEEASEGKMVAALKRIGFDYVFDTNFAADLTIMEEGNELLERLDNVVSNEFGRVSYTEAVDILQKSGEKFEFPVEWGIDLQSEHERYLTEKVFKKPIFVTDYPVAIKAFYMRLNDDGKTVAAADLLVPGVGEIIGGSQREDRYDVLKARCDQLGMDMSEYQWYLDLRRYGGVEHAGFGLGLDRIVMYLTGMSNIRDVAPFPRTTANLEM